MESQAATLGSYRNFLVSIRLDEYRTKFKDVKWVEQDLPKDLLPQASIFKRYWYEQNFLDFDSWFEEFWRELHSNAVSITALKDFKKYYFDKDNDGWFKLGFKARMYRTWTAVLTQLDFCYMFAYVCQKQGKGVTLEASAELDISGVDLRVGDIDFEVGKITQRKEARSAAVARRNRIQIPYAVFNVSEYTRKSISTRVSPDNRNAYRNALHAFQKYFVLLSNGFVVFYEYYLDQIVKNLDDPDKIKASIRLMLVELSGE
jgi:hypothetical protein